jgi:hypothetical protein
MLFLTFLAFSPFPTAQIDLVPSLALLLGAPIPFANLGQVIPDLFLGSMQAPPAHSLAPDAPSSSASSHDRRDSASQNKTENEPHSLPPQSPPQLPQWSLLAAALRQNAWQVYRYLETYHRAHASAPGIESAHAADVESFIRAGDRFHRLSLDSDSDLDLNLNSAASTAAAPSSSNPHSAAKTAHERALLRREFARRAAVAYREFMRRSLALCRDRWVTFDFGRMTLGALLLPAIVGAAAAWIALAVWASASTLARARSLRTSFKSSARTAVISFAASASALSSTPDEVVSEPDGARSSAADIVAVAPLVCTAALACFLLCAAAVGSAIAFSVSLVWPALSPPECAAIAAIAACVLWVEDVVATYRALARCALRPSSGEAFSNSPPSLFSRYLPSSRYRSHGLVRLAWAPLRWICFRLGCIHCHDTTCHQGHSEIAISSGDSASAIASNTASASKAVSAQRSGSPRLGPLAPKWSQSTAVVRRSSRLSGTDTGTASSSASAASVAVTNNIASTLPSPAPSATSAPLVESIHANAVPSGDSISARPHWLRDAADLCGLTRIDSAAAWISLSLLCGSHFSNSFVVAESAVVMWAAACLALLRAFGVFRAFVIGAIELRHQHHGAASGALHQQTAGSTAAVAAAAAVSLRASASVRRLWALFTMALCTRALGSFDLVTVTWLAADASRLCFCAAATIIALPAVAAAACVAEWTRRCVARHTFRGARRIISFIDCECSNSIS